MGGFPEDGLGQVKRARITTYGWPSLRAHTRVVYLRRLSHRVILGTRTRVEPAACSWTACKRHYKCRPGAARRHPCQRDGGACPLPHLRPRPGAHVPISMVPTRPHTRVTPLMPLMRPQTPLHPPHAPPLTPLSHPFAPPRTPAHTLAPRTYTLLSPYQGSAVTYHLSGRKVRAAPPCAAGGEVPGAKAAPDTPGAATPAAHGAWSCSRSRTARPR